MWSSAEGSIYPRRLHSLGSLDTERRVRGVTCQSVSPLRNVSFHSFPSLVPAGWVKTLIEHLRHLVAKTRWCLCSPCFAKAELLSWFTYLDGAPTHFGTLCPRLPVKQVVYIFPECTPPVFLWWIIRQRFPTQTRNRDESLSTVYNGIYFWEVG